MGSNETYEVFALRYAESIDRKRGDNFKVTDDHDAPMPLDYFVWVVRNDKRTIVVDTGFGEMEAKQRGRRLLQTPVQALERLQVDAKTVEDVVITHLHYDHAGSLSEFPGARFHLQESEMVFATGPAMLNKNERWPFSVGDVCEMVHMLYEDRLVFHAEDAEIAPGITLHRLPGHTAGMQVVRVATQRGVIVLASDATHFYENFARRSAFSVCWSEEQMLQSFARLEDLADSEDHVIPGHDPLVRSLYPAPTAELEGWVCRLDRRPDKSLRSLGLIL